MASIIKISNYALPVTPAKANGVKAATTVSEAPRWAEVAGGSATDTVELSQEGRELARAVDQTSLRMARIATIREAIENGTFETDTRIAGTVSRLMKVLSWTS